MLDLRKLTERLYEVTLADGKIIHLQKPTQAMYVAMIELTGQDYTRVEILEKLMSLLVRIFNRNTEGVIFKRKDFESFSLETVMYILADYGDFLKSEMGE